MKLILGDKDMGKFNVLDHKMVPDFSILSDAETAEVLQKYVIGTEHLPEINAADPCIKAIGAKPGQVVKIVRNSQTAGEAVVYRRVKE